MRRFLFILALFQVHFLFAQSQLFRFFPLDSEYVPSMYWGSANRITPCADGGYYLNYQFADCVTLHSTAMCYGTEIIKTDSLFNSQWSVNMGHNFNQCMTFPQADSSVVAVSFGVEPYAKKIDRNGNVEWMNYYKASYPVQTSAVGAIPHNSSIEFAGMISTSSMYTYISAAGFLLDIDTSGNIVQVDSLKFSGFTFPSIDAIGTDAAGNRYIAGKDHISGSNVFVAKLQSNNTVVWCKTLSGFGAYTPSFSHVTPLSDGSIIIDGIAYDPNAGMGAPSFYHLDQNGNILWTKSFPYPGKSAGMTQMPNGNLLVSMDFRYFYGDTLTGLIMEMTPAGNIIWDHRLAPGFGLGPAFMENTNSFVFPFFTVAPTVFRTDSMGLAPCYGPSVNLAFNSLSITGTNSTCTFYPISFQTIAQQLDSVRLQPQRDTCIVSVVTGIQQPKTEELSISPNPSNGSFHCRIAAGHYEIRVMDVMGNIVRDEKREGNSFDIDLRDEPDGIYFVRISSADSVETRTLILSR